MAGPRRPPPPGVAYWLLSRRKEPATAGLQAPTAPAQKGPVSAQTPGQQTRQSADRNRRSARRAAVSVRDVDLGDDARRGNPDDKLGWYPVAATVVLRAVGAHVPAADAGRPP